MVLSQWRRWATPDTSARSLRGISSTRGFMSETPGGDVIRLTASQLAAYYQGGDLSPVEVAASYLARIDAIDPEINSFCLVDPDSTMAAARLSELRILQGRSKGPLDGVPVAIKDVVTTAAWPTRKGSRAGSAAGVFVDAPAVERIQEAGGVLLGKTTTPELGWKAITDSPLTGVTRNPWDPAMTSGGSSGGSAAAVAAHLAPLALGTDGGGSIRIPSSFCGVVGLKPTHGLVPQWPPSAFGILSHLGPHARNSSDAALLLSVIAGTSPLDPYSASPRSHEWTPEPVPPLDSLRIAYSPDFGRVQVQSDVARSVRDAVEDLDQLGAEVEVLQDVGFEDPLSDFEAIWYAGAARAIEKLAPQDLEMLDPGFLDIALKGLEIPASAYVAALESRVRLSVAVDRILSQFDVLITPTVPIDAFATGTNVPAGWPDSRWMSWTPFTYPFNLTGHPAVSVPCGVSERGLPIGVQIVGRKFEDGLLLGIGARLEAARGLFSPPGLR